MSNEITNMRNQFETIASSARDCVSAFASVPKVQHPSITQAFAYLKELGQVKGSILVVLSKIKTDLSNTLQETWSKNIDERIRIAKEKIQQAETGIKAALEGKPKGEGLILSLQALFEMALVPKVVRLSRPLAHVIGRITKIKEQFKSDVKGLETAVKTRDIGGLLLFGLSKVGIKFEGY